MWHYNGHHPGHENARARASAEAPHAPPARLAGGRFYLSLTRLSQYGLRGRRFIMSDSAVSYASEMAGTYVIDSSSGGRVCSIGADTDLVELLICCWFVILDSSVFFFKYVVFRSGGGRRAD